MLQRLCIFFALAAATLTATAAEPLRPVTSAWMLEAGSSHLADTYLSPIKYSGQHYAVTYARLQALKSNEHLAQGLQFTLDFDRAKNPAGNSTMYQARIDASWRMLWRMRLPAGFSFGAGGYVGLEAGALALMRNGNNPVQALAALSVGPEVYGRWNGKVGRMPLAATWQLSTPLVGAFFCPDYGELYYEIALGNHSGLAHFGWPGNRRRLRSLLSVDLNLGGTTLRLGYRFDGLSSRANNITSRRVEHSAVLGIVCDFISLNPRKPITDAQVITAYY